MILNDQHLKSWLYSGDVLGQAGEDAYYFVGSMARLLLPALFAISLTRLDGLRDVPTGATHLASILRAP